MTAQGAKHRVGGGGNSSESKCDVGVGRSWGVGGGGGSRRVGFRPQSCGGRQGYRETTMEMVWVRWQKEPLGPALPVQHGVGSMSDGRGLTGVGSIVAEGRPG